MRVPAAFLYGLAVFGLDLWTKHWAHEYLQYRDIDLIPHFFKLSLVHNTGIAFGLFDDPGSPNPTKSVVLISVAVAALLIVGIHAVRTPPRPRLAHLALGLLLGGILGNMVDRIAHSYVADFLDFNLYFFKFPTFNLADTAITLGVGLLLLETLRETEAPADSYSRNLQVPTETGK